MVFVAINLGKNGKKERKKNRIGHLLNPENHGSVLPMFSVMTNYLCLQMNYFINF